MPHNKHVIDGINKDLIKYSRQDYLDMLGDWEDPYGIPKVEMHDGFYIVRDDYIEGAGSKSRFGDFLISQVKEDTIVYVQPRFGLAGVSILECAKRYNKKVVLFMPSSKEISLHQACCIERGAIPKFRRIAAMPNLNRIAKKWAEENGAFFVPLGLYHPLVVAGAVKTADTIIKEYGEPEEMFLAISTGVLSRGLQIGFPNTKFHSVAVARNLKAGELGRSEVHSDPRAFTQNEKEEECPPFPSVRNYDCKVYKYLKKYGTVGKSWMWNVGAEPILKDHSIYKKIDSQRDWGEIRDEN